MLEEDNDWLFSSGDEGDPLAALAPPTRGGGGKGKVAAGGMVESERDRAIRLGLLTPFGALAGYERRAVAGGGVAAGGRGGAGPGGRGAPAPHAFDR